MIKVVYDNILLVNGEFMTARKGPDVLEHTLRTNRDVITDAISSMYRRYRTTAPEVQRGSIWTMRLGDEPEDVLTASAIDENSTVQVNRGVFSDPGALRNRYLPFWSAVLRSGLIAEIRTNRPPAHVDADGVFLLVRDTPLV